MVSLGALVSAKRSPTLALSARPVSATAAPQAKDNKPASATISGAFALAQAARPTPKKAVIAQQAGWAARPVMPMARDIPRVIVKSVAAVKMTPKAVNARISKRAYRLAKTQNGGLASNAAWSTTSAAPREISKTALARIRLQVFAFAKRTSHGGFASAMLPRVSSVIRKKDFASVRSGSKESALALRMLEDFQSGGPASVRAKKAISSIVPAPTEPKANARAVVLAESASGWRAVVRVAPPTRIAKKIRSIPIATRHSTSVSLVLTTPIAPLLPQESAVKSLLETVLLVSKMPIVRAETHAILLPQAAR